MMRDQTFPAARRYVPRAARVARSLLEPGASLPGTDEDGFCRADVLIDDGTIAAMEPAVITDQAVARSR